MAVLQEKYPDLVSKFEKAENFSTLDKAMNQVKEEADEGCTVTEITEDAPQISQVAVPAYINYIFLKYRLLQARIHKASSMNHKAHEICIEIIQKVRL